MENGARLISSALIGLDGETVVVNGRAYFVSPPTIKKIAGAGYYITKYGGEKTIGDMLKMMSQSMDACKALSWFIQGNEDLADELSNGTINEVVDGLETCIKLISTENFLRLSLLARNVRSVIAKQK